MKKFYFTIAALFMLTACSFGEKPEKTEDTYVYEEFTGVVARERFTQANYAKLAYKYILFEDGKVMTFRKPSDELILAEPGDTIVYQDNGECLEVRFKK